MTLFKRLKHRLLGQKSTPTPVKSIPHFLIIGVQKGGTTSLYAYLQQHPQIQASLTKEVHFFDLNFDKAWDWYQQQLGVKGQEFDSQNVVTGEASPYYIFHPLVPARIFERSPNVKLIILLRDPVARALSQYHHECRWDFESLPLRDAFAQEESRLSGEAEQFAQDSTHQSYAFQHYSYQARGQYLDQLRVWQKYFSPEQMLIIQSEFFDQNSAFTLQRVLEFLELNPFDFTPQQRHNSGKYPDAPEDIKQNLALTFADKNRELLAHLEHHWPGENLLGFGPGEVNWLTPSSEQ